MSNREVARSFDKVMKCCEVISRLVLKARVIICRASVAASVARPRVPLDLAQLQSCTDFLERVTKGEQNAAGVDAWVLRVIGFTRPFLRLLTF